MHAKKMKHPWLASMLIVMTYIGSSCGTDSNLTQPEVPIESAITSEDDSEQELSSQLQEVDVRTGGWSPWSEWTPCSRSCDGGVSHQMRTCKSGSCRGDHVRYKICNMQGPVVFVVAVAAASASLLAAPAIDGAAILKGPSGVVIRNGGLVAAAPALVASPLAIAAARGALGLGLGLGGLVIPPGSGLEGQWIPDINEKLHDDGSYKPLLNNAW